MPLERSRSVMSKAGNTDEDGNVRWPYLDIGSLESRKKAALEDPAFSSVKHHSVGVFVWVATSDSLIQNPTNQMGKFYAGNAYVVLNITSSRDGMVREIYCWFGKNSPRASKGIAASKAVDLDDILDCQCVEFHEHMHCESPVFLSLWNQFGGFRHIPGSYSEADAATDDDGSQFQLYRLFGKSREQMFYEHEIVPVSKNSLNGEDIFALKKDCEIWFWCKGSKGSKRVEAEVASLEDWIMSIWASNEDPTVHYVSDELFNNLVASDEAGAGKASSENSLWTQDAKKNSVLTLSKMTLEGKKASFEVVGKGVLTANMLDASSIMVLSHGPDIIVWVGRAALECLRWNPIGAGRAYQEFNKLHGVFRMTALRDAHTFKCPLWTDSIKAVDKAAMLGTTTKILPEDTPQEKPEPDERKGSMRAGATGAATDKPGEKAGSCQNCTVM